MLGSIILAAAIQAPAIHAESWPANPYAEVTGSGVAVDGDILVRNETATAMELTEIAVDVRDSAGRLLQRRELNGNGTSPSIALVTERSLPAGGALLIYNPFSSFPPDIEPARLDYGLTFSPSNEGADDRIVQVSVTPRPEPSAAFTFPTRGRILIWDGHDFTSHHRRWNFLHPVLKQAGFASTAGRYSLDIIHVDETGQRSTGDEADNANWLAFGQPAVAVASGVITSIKSSDPDNRKFDVANASVPNALYGNYVVIRHGDGSHSMYGHLQQASVTVAPGQAVKAGETIGRIGASGSALFPHLHFQRMDGPTDRSEGVPTRFRNVVRPDGKAPTNGFVDSGDILVVQ